MSKTFGLIGASGFVGVRHIKAIYETKNELVDAMLSICKKGIRPE